MLIESLVKIFPAKVEKKRYLPYFPRYAISIKYTSENLVAAKFILSQQLNISLYF
ncbi:hypothetical protein [Pontibacter chinhatensis]|uniref:hypothetical protein n=1 Tax=Pontibacter chinhatensis TaxID=1436961 RepID=UPI001587A320|nr:hypothetical protein [Pontibacter chinhatensis]